MKYLVIILSLLMIAPAIQADQNIVDECIPGIPQNEPCVSIDRITTSSDNQFLCISAVNNVYVNLYVTSFQDPSLFVCMPLGRDIEDPNAYCYGVYSGVPPVSYSTTCDPRGSEPGGNPLDQDNDDYPDAFESELCGRAATRDAVNDPLFPGKCTSSTNLEMAPPAEIVFELYDLVVGEIFETYEFVYETIEDEVLYLVDEDADKVPDVIEPTLCSVENQNTPLDGTCVGDDYTP